MSTRKTIRKHLTPANVLSTVALCVAVGGGSAVAATQLASNSVGSRQIRDGSVGVKDLSAAAKRNVGATSKAKVAAVVEEVITDPQYGINITVKGEAGAKGDAGAQGNLGVQGSPGADGPQGTAGPQGVQGQPGIAGLQRVNGASIDLLPGQTTLALVAQCPAGKQAISGGLVAGSSLTFASELEPTVSGTGFRATAKNTATSGNSATAYVWVLCAVVG